MYLRKRKKATTGLEVSANPAPTQQDTEGKKKTLTAAERQRIYRQKVKEDEEKYNNQKEFDQLRCQLWRMDRSEAQQQRDRETGRERSRRYRARKKASGNSPPVRRTRKSTLAQAEKWRDQKKGQRAQMSNQKLRRVNEKRRQLYAEKKAKEKSTAERKAAQQIETSTPFGTGCAKRKALSRSWRVLPRSPNKFAEVLSSVVSNSTPKRKAALKRKCILSPSNKKKLAFYQKYSVKKVFAEIRKKRNTKHLEFRRLLHRNVVLKNKLKKKTAHKNLGLSWNFLSKNSHLGLDCRKKRSDALSDDTKNTVRDFFNRVDISRELPCRSTTKSPKRVMECSFKKAHSMFCQEYPMHKLSFCTFYKIKPKNIKPMAATNLLQCLCEYCVNVNFLLTSLNMKCLQVGHSNTIRNKYDAVKETLCPQSGQFPRKTCIDRVCGKCGTKNIRAKYQPLIESHGNDPIKWKEWTTKDHDSVCRMALVERSRTVEDLISALEARMDPFAKHINNARWQAQQFQAVTKDVPPEWVVLCLDFGENYNCHYQDEAQSAHWSYQQATLHSVVTYYKCPEEECKEMCRESMMMISNDRKHDQHAVQHYIAVANKYLKDQGIEMKHQIQFSDGSPTQYKSKANFIDMSHSIEDFGFETHKHFFGSRHGKGPCDGEIGVVKRSASTAVKTRQVVISNAQDLYTYGKTNLTIPLVEGEHVHFKRVFFWIEEGQILRNREDRFKNVKAIKDTRQQHEFGSSSPYVVQSRERSCFCKSCISGNGECGNKEFTGQFRTSSLSAKCAERRGIQDTDPRKGDKTPRDDTLTGGVPGHEASCTSKSSSVLVPRGDGHDPDVQSTQASVDSSSCGQSVYTQSPNRDVGTYLDFRPGDFAAVVLNGKLSSSVFMTEILEIIGQEVHVKYMKKCTRDLYMWPTVEDSSWEPASCLICKVKYPDLANKREQFRFSAEDMEKVRKCLPKALPFS